MAQDRTKEQDNRQAQQGNPGNFANDRERASEAGRKGGHESSGNFAHDRERASEAGRKGGSSGQQR
ncbi:hypothetical protein STVA_04750 [Allostella vacuolata]|nr:hypothetical protein STVA_04750 [Stella vacuolata]